jgi:RNA-directed DNA polymerase
VLLDEVDKELERSGHCFVRYADDANVYVRSRRAGERVMALLRRLYGKLNLTLNEAKSAVASAFGANSWATASGQSGKGWSNAGWLTSRLRRSGSGFVN